MKYRDLLRYLVLLRDGVQSVAAESAAAVCLPRTLLKKKKVKKRNFSQIFLVLEILFCMTERVYNFNTCSWLSAIKEVMKCSLTSCDKFIF